MSFINTKEFLLGYVRSNTWGNFGSNMGVLDGFLFLSENLGVVPRERLKDESIGEASGHFTTVNLGNHDSSKKTITEWLRISGSEIAFGYCLGSEVITTFGNYTNHEFTPATNIDTYFRSMAIREKESDPLVARSYPSIKYDGIKISGESGNLLLLESSVIPSHMVNSTAVGANAATATNFNNLSIFDGYLNGRVRFDLGKFWMKDSSASTFNESDVVCPSKFEFTYMRNLEVYSCSDGSTGLDSAKIEEPTGGGYPEVKVILDFPVKSDDDNVTDHLDGTYKKLKCQWPVTYIGSDAVNQLELFFPKVDIENIDSAADSLGKMMEPLDMSCYAVSSAVSGIPNTTPFTISVNNYLNSPFTAY